MEYIILSSVIESGLIESVNRYLKIGFKPVGGICVAGNKFYQAMIKE